MLSAAVRAANIRGVLETVPTYRSLMVLHDPLAIDSTRLMAKLESLMEDLVQKRRPAEPAPAI